MTDEAGYFKELYSWDFPDTVEVLDGYDLKSVPDNTRSNFNVLLKQHNEMVKMVNLLLEHAGAFKA